MSENFKKGSEPRTRTTFKVTVAGRRVVDFSTLRKGDKFILQDDGPLLGGEKGNVCNVATSDAYLRGGIWTIDCEEIEGSPVKRIKRGSHPDDWNKPFTIKSSPKVTEEDLLNDDPLPFFRRPSEVAEEITEIEDERVLAAALGASKDFLEGPTTYSTSSIGYDPTIRQLVRKMADPFFRAMTRDEYVKANLVGEMRKHRGRKRLRKKKAKAASKAMGFPVRFPDWDEAGEPPEAPINCSYCMDSGIDPDNGLECAMPAHDPVILGEGCPACGSPEVDAMNPRTVYACGSSDYDGRPDTFSQKCGGGEE